MGFGINGTWSTTYRNVVVFARDSTDIGYLQINNTNYQFVNASDHRLKTNVRDLSNPWQYLDAMQVRRFNWVLDPDGPTQCGFVAHELAEVIPLAVSGEKDAVDRQGQPEHQNLNLKKVVPVLTAGIRDLQNRVAQLRAQVNQ